MKHAIVLLWILCPLRVVGQTSPTDTTRSAAALRATASLSQSVSALSQNVTTLSRSVSALSTRTDTLTKRVDTTLKPTDCTFCQTELGFQQKALALMPLLLFIVASFYVLSRLRQEGYKLSDALKENYTVDVKDTTEPATAKAEAVAQLKAQGANEAELAEAATSQPTEVRPQSTSRLIAFFAGMAAIIISVSAMSFFFYVYLRTGKEPKFESLWNVVLGLGVGVVPYAFNRVSDALNPRPTK